MREGGDTVCRMRAARGYSQEAFAQKAGLNKAYMGGVERGQRNVGVVILPGTCSPGPLPCLHSPVRRECRGLCPHWGSEPPSPSPIQPPDRRRAVFSELLPLVR
jgi:transcriptional regulator with XRE-family HTH domain